MEHIYFISKKYQNIHFTLNKTWGSLILSKQRTTSQGKKMVYISSYGLSDNIHLLTLYEY